MIIWRGKGLLVLLAIFLGATVTSVIFAFIPVNTGYKSGYLLQGVLMTLIVAVINLIFTKHFISQEIKVYIDEETGDRILIKDGSHLFFIPNRYWTWIIIIFGVIITIGSSSIYS